MSGRAAKRRRRGRTNAEWFEICRNEALKYARRGDFAKGSFPIYLQARRRGFLDPVCGHMEPAYEVWTEDRCQREALPYRTPGEFLAAAPKAYRAAARNGWLRSATAHMTYKRKPRGYWTYKRCRLVALRYTSRDAFQKGDRACWLFAYRRGWLDRICRHMERQGSKAHRFIYVIRSACASTAYVGLTFNKEVRLAAHASRGRAAVKALLAGSHTVCFSPLVKQDAAATFEALLIDYLRLEGVTVLNAQRGGNLGGAVLRWTFEACAIEARKHTTRSAFMKAGKGAYESARLRGWLDSTCTHMKPGKTPNGTWSKARCAFEALKYRSPSEFERQCPGAYNASLNGGWNKEICVHMTPLRRIWTDETLTERAMQFASVKDFCAQDCGAYQAAARRGLLPVLHHRMRRKITSAAIATESASRA